MTFEDYERNRIATIVSEVRKQEAKHYTLDKRVSPAAVITAAVALLSLLGIIGGWVTFGARFVAAVDGHTESIHQIQRDIKAATESIGQMGWDVKSVTENVSRIEANLTEAKKERDQQFSELTAQFNDYKRRLDRDEQDRIYPGKKGMTPP